MILVVKKQQWLIEYEKFSLKCQKKAIEKYTVQDKPMIYRKNRYKYFIEQS